MATRDLLARAHQDAAAFVKAPVTTTRGALAEPAALALASSSGLVRRAMDAGFGALGLAPATDTELATAMVCFTVPLTQLVYWALLGKRHRTDRKELRRELRQAENQVTDRPNRTEEASVVQ